MNHTMTHIILDQYCGEILDLTMVKSANGRGLEGIEPRLGILKWVIFSEFHHDFYDSCYMSHFRSFTMLDQNCGEILTLTMIMFY